MQPSNNTMKTIKRSPAEYLEEFLNFVDTCYREHQLAYDNVAKEDKRLQDLLHEMEFAKDTAEQNRVATKLQHSRKCRRQSKDDMKKYEKIVQFFDDSANRRALNQMRQLLGKQRKEEEYLTSKRIYKPRMESQD